MKKEKKGKKVTHTQSANIKKRFFIEKNPLKTCFQHQKGMKTNKQTSNVPKQIGPLSSRSKNSNEKMTSNNHFEDMP